MATSSIFHNIIIRDEAAAERFITALEEAAAHPLKGSGRPIEEVLASREDNLRWIELWEKKHKQLRFTI